MRNYYHLSINFLRKNNLDVVDKFFAAKDKALVAKKEFLNKEQAIAILRRENKGIGLIYETRIERSGFTLPTKYESWWLLKPKMNTLIGKRIKKEMDIVCQTLEDWQWCVEKALNLEESVFDNKLKRWDLTYCIVLPDDKGILVSRPEGAISYHRNTREIKQKYLITEQQFNQLRELE